LRLPRFGFFFLLPRQHGLEHVAGFGNVGEIDLGSDRLRSARRRIAWPGGPCLPLEVRANPVGLLRLKRAGVRFPSGHADFRKNIENRARLDFQLFREIVDTNLAHPPLFEIFCRQKP
jgi:hypothetical protein